jgi:hypothetical protein
MADKKERKLLSLGTQWCPQYMTNVTLYIEQKATGRNLVAQYEEGSYKDLREFAAGIPSDWTEQDVRRLISMLGSKT